MIKLHKGPEPEVLVDHGADWTAALIAALGSDAGPTQTQRSRYRHPQIKEALVKETHGKCAYCESKLQHIHHGDVEHIFPKSLDPGKAFEWSNLTLSCEICNQKKSDTDPTKIGAIDPYKIDPKQHIRFAGMLAFSRGSTSGEVTIELFELNRLPLLEQRRDRLEKLMMAVNAIERMAGSEEFRARMWEKVSIEFASEESVYSAMADFALNSVRNERVSQ